RRRVSAFAPHLVAHLPSLCLLYRRPPTSTLSPYTTLFRSHVGRLRRRRPAHRLGRRARLRGHRPAGRHLRPLGLREQPQHLRARSEEHTSELQSRENLVCRLLLEKKNNV